MAEQREGTGGDGDLGKYFEDGAECEVLGIKLVRDPARAGEEFSEYAGQGWTRCVSVYVTEPGPAAELGFIDLRAGDLINSTGGQQSACGSAVVNTPADFVTGLAANWFPCAGTECHTILGSDRKEGPKKHWSNTSIVCVPGEKAAGLKELAGRLSDYAAGRGLPLVRPRRHYGGGNYVLHLLGCAFRRAVSRIRRGHDDRATPAHERYWWRLVMNATGRAPFEFVLDAAGEEVEVLPGPGEEEKAATLGRSVTPFAAGSRYMLFRIVRRWARDTEKFGRVGFKYCCFGEFHYKVKMEGKYRARISVERVGDAACATASQTPR
ncbi:MAG: hypothetical protein JW909_13565 [Planctomycetes bacterium]|nr:hypothetical protein [Planctomycetota bacterium]